MFWWCAVLLIKRSSLKSAVHAYWLDVRVAKHKQILFNRPKCKKQFECPARCSLKKLCAYVQKHASVVGYIASFTAADEITSKNWLRAKKQLTQKSLGIQGTAASGSTATPVLREQVQVQVYVCLVCMCTSVCVSGVQANRTVLLSKSKVRQRCGTYRGYWVVLG